MMCTLCPGWIQAGADAQAGHHGAHVQPRRPRHHRREERLEVVPEVPTVRRGRNPGENAVLLLTRELIIELCIEDAAGETYRMGMQRNVDAIARNAGQLGCEGSCARDDGGANLQRA